MIDAVVFDVGEALVDETREYGTWADWLGVPRHTFSAVFGAVIALGLDYRDAFQYFRPGFSLDAERARRADAGRPECFGEDDLYPDVRPCLTALRDMGVWVGVAGNQTSRAGELLRSLDLPAVRRHWRTMMDELDGNGAAGLLQEVFGAAMTVAVTTCASCGSATQLGESVLYAGGPGTVIRCRTCAGVLVVITGCGAGTAST